MYAFSPARSYAERKDADEEKEKVETGLSSRRVEGCRRRATADAR